MGNYEPQGTSRYTILYSFASTNLFQVANPIVRTKFVQNLFFIILNILDNYETPLMLKLLGKSEYELLAAFRKVGNIYGWYLKHYLVNTKDLY